MYVRWQRRVYRHRGWTAKTTTRYWRAGHYFPGGPDTISYRAVLVEAVRVHGQPRQRRIASLGQISAEAWADEGARRLLLLDLLAQAQDEGRITAAPRRAVLAPPTEAEAAQLARWRAVGGQPPFDWDG